MTNPHSFSDAVSVAQTLGWKVFPVNPANKQPLVRGWQNVAAAEEDDLRILFTPFPNAMIGVPTGPINGISVLDVDRRPDVNGPENFLATGFRIPRTPAVHTPSGGFHLYFDTGMDELSNSASKIAEGVDFRGAGGYVVAPPSVSVRGQYSWVLDWVSPTGSFAKIPPDLLAKIDQTRTRPYRAGRRSEVGARINEPVFEGRRNDEMARRCGFLLKKYSPEKALKMVRHINERLVHPPLDDRELERTFLSIARREFR